MVISDEEKTIFFVGQIEKSGLFESKFIDNYDDEAEKSWTATGTIFVRKYDRDMRRIKREAENKYYKSMAAMRGVSRSDNLGTPMPPRTANATAQEYIAVLEGKAAMQDARIEELIARNPPATVPTTDVAAATSTITGGTGRSRKKSTQLTELHSFLATMMKTVATQAAAMTALNKQVVEGANRRSDIRRKYDRRGSGRRGDENKEKPQQKNTLAQSVSYRYGTRRKTARNTRATPTNDGQDGKVHSDRIKRGGRY